MFRIAWRTETGLTGNGDYILTMDLANAWIQHLRKEYPYMYHWVERNPKQD